MPMRGRVAEYDDHKGYGELEVEGGGRLFFHCTAIANGSRSIAVGAEVEYEPRTDPRGKHEAANVRPLGPSTV